MMVQADAWRRTATVVACSLLATLAAERCAAGGSSYLIRLINCPALMVSDSEAHSFGISSRPGSGPPPALPSREGQPPQAPPAWEGRDAVASQPVPVEASTQLTTLELVAVPPPAATAAAGPATPADPGSPPPDAFVQYLKTIYGILDAADVAAVWGGVAGEPGSLAQNARWSNAVIRWTAANPGKVSDASTADFGTASATRVVAASAGGGGVSMRSEPWGPMTGDVPNGTSVEVLGQDGIWFHVRAGGREGWICGLWARAQ